MAERNDTDSQPLRLSGYIYVLASVWTALVIASLAWNVYQEKLETRDMAIAQARLALGEEAIYRHTGEPDGDVARSNGGRAPLEVTRTDNLEGDGSAAPREATTPPDSAAMTRRARDAWVTQHGIRGHVTSLNPLNPANAPDSWETEVLRRFERGETEAHVVASIEGQEFMRLMRPVTADESCLGCHGGLGYQPGDVCGGIGVSLPMAPLQAIAEEHAVACCAGHVLLWLFGLASSGLAARHLRRRIHERNQAQLALRRSNAHLQRLNTQLMATTRELKEVLEHVAGKNGGSTRFLNPSLVRCWENQDCDTVACPCHGRDDRLRCWEVTGTHCGGEIQGAFAEKLERCAKCDVYLAARRDPVYKLGEAFNDTMALLEDRQQELARALRAAEAATQAKSEFLANMSHEIRTPMTAILGYAETLLEPGLSESERLDAVYTIRRNGEHLLEILNGILDLSKIEAGKLDLERIVCSPVQLVADVVSLMRVRADSKGLQLFVECIGPQPELIRSDPTRLRQILINLVGNAIKFTEEGGVRLIVRFVEHAYGDPMMQFDVVDSGIGLTEEHIARLFRPFSQADSSTTRNFGGSGLGLMISKRLAQMLGGDITVSSIPEKGSTFRVTVATGPLDGQSMLDSPNATIGAVKTPPESDPEAEPRDEIKLDCRILLAEDGPDNQRLISFILRKSGADVCIVENGRLAVDAALEAQETGDPFDVILMDMQMPVLDGYQAVSLLRVKGYTRPIVALTAHAMASDRERCLSVGCDDFASKPVDRWKLLEMVQAHADRVRTGNVADRPD